MNNKTAAYCCQTTFKYHSNLRVEDRSLFRSEPKIHSKLPTLQFMNALKTIQKKPFEAIILFVE